MLFKKPFAKIVGSGIYLPERIVSNQELELLGSQRVNWIEKRTGIRERRECGEGEDLFLMSVEAADAALKDAKTKDFDTIIVARSRFRDERCFVNAGAVHAGLKLKGYSLESVDYVDGFYACGGSLVALNEASLRISAGQSKRALIVASSLGSKFRSRFHLESSCLWGDGAAAWVVERAEKAGVLAYQGKGLSEAWSAFPLKTDEEGCSYIQLDGQKIFHTVITEVPRFVQTSLQETGHSLGDISCFLFHQANGRMNERLCEKLKIPAEKVYTNIGRYGNTSAASIPLAYHEAKKEGRLKEKDFCLMVGFGAAFHMNCILYQI